MSDHHVPAGAARALSSLRGLAVGDALGTQLAQPRHHSLPRTRTVPAPPWGWTDDTEMACAVVAVLLARGEMDQDELARTLAARHDPDRGYGRSMQTLLLHLRERGADWREHAAALFDGRGSWGNGAAVRVAPLGAWYAGDPERAAQQAELSAYVTHQHREAVAGAIAVAVAASVTAAAGAGEPPTGEVLLGRVLETVPRSAVQQGLRRARDMLDYSDPGTVAAVLGRGRRTGAHDTVPFALWAAGRHPGNFEEALWPAARTAWDTDTICAITGGVIAAGGAAPPASWTGATERLPDWFTALTG